MTDLLPGNDQPTVDPLAIRNKADWLWLAIQAQNKRVLERVPGGRLPSHIEVAQLSNECDAYIEAVNRLLRLVELTEAEIPGAGLREALRAFRAASPHIEVVRNTIEHFDAYSLGKGTTTEKTWRAD